MAKGDFTFFNQFLLDEGLKLHNLDTDSIKLAYINNTVTPTAATADPRWGAGGTTNLSSNEVTGGNFAAGGIDVAVTFSGTPPTLDATDQSIAADGSNPNDVFWGILYNDTDTGKRAIGFYDMNGGAALDCTPGLNFNFHASGIATKAQS